MARHKKRKSRHNHSDSCDHDDDDYDDYDDEEGDIDWETPLIPIRNETPKIGRNDPCPCGSGKKYKKCHLNKND